MNGIEKTKPTIMRSPVVSLDDVSVIYQGDDKPIIKNCTLQIGKGETVLVVGPSGSGKSTLAMAVAGLIPRSVDGVVQGDLHLDESLRVPGQIGYVFQDPDAQFCMLTVEDEVAFGLENLNIPRNEMPERIRRALDTVNLGHTLHEQHATFSGGTKQKLAIASALAMDAELLILDEPTANLDPLSTRQIYELIVKLRSSGQTMLVIEHKYEPLLPYVDKVVAFNEHGEIDTICSGSDWLHHRSKPVERASIGRKRTEGQATGRTTGLVVDAVPVVQLDHVGLKYGSKRIWHDVSMRLYGGEWVAIVGPNGAGKSSLIEVMAGLIKPDQGSVRLADRLVHQIPARERYESMAFGFQNPEYQFLFERVGDEMAGRIVGDDVPADVLRSLEEFGLQDHAGDSPYALSQGQKRRLAVGVMMRDDHDVYLFDEPTYGQDELSEAVILSRLDLLRGEGKTIVTVTHDMDMVRRFASRVIVLADGGIIFDGDVGALFTREDVLVRAHLLDDTREIAIDRSTANRSRPQAQQRGAMTSVDDGKRLESHDARRPGVPMWRIHPSVKLLTLLAISIVTLFANSFAQLGRLWIVVLIISFGLGWCSPWKMVKRLWLIVLLYGVYVWTFAANAAIPAGAKQIDWLWFHISAYGMWQGVLVSIRTFATVVLAYVFLETTDGTDFVESLSQTFKVTPKLSYGVMAGTSFIPRFQRELRTFRFARQVRGRQGWWLTRPVTYALPMLSQSIRLGERVAIAMEARGFYDAPAQQSTARTYFRRTPLSVWDGVFAVGAVALTVVLFVVRGR
ncbi:ATP-binding cassette domain-containing protein [Alicyclobacillus dauci]|uniref:ATP-binding cassette domain-containing protein n=1 Tax=Alicyclobacillus dauci TaxID=1475485 RepID=A0ABY6YZ82_9BACL|nr:ATP-binding cassette domain-containing protein [Alicyclobacillus dauci]WAH35896.1 ATP-binding cassette domain-containing protein [Alicyclobacillus dauci]